MPIKLHVKSSPKTFSDQFSTWEKSVQRGNVNWAEQLRLLNEISDLITPDLTLQQISETIYKNINHLIDASQFSIGLYDEKEAVILYQGIIENGKPLQDFIVHAIDDNRLTSWCIRHEQDIIINDMDKEFKKYLDVFPEPLMGFKPKAAIYSTLKLGSKVVGILVVRTTHKNAYKPYHLYILKTVGNFVVRGLEISKTFSQPIIQIIGLEKEWRWRDNEQLSFRSKEMLKKLTEREKEVVYLLMSGLPNKSMAEKLFVSAGTIKTHTLNIYQKLDVSNRTSAILKALSYGWFL